MQLLKLWNDFPTLRIVSQNYHLDQSYRNRNISGAENIDDRVEITTDEKKLRRLRHDDEVGDENQRDEKDNVRDNREKSRTF